MELSLVLKEFGEEGGYFAIYYIVFSLIFTIFLFMKL